VCSKTTVRVPAFWTTWSEVRMSPASSMITPDPELASVPSERSALICTTEGATFAYTSLTSGVGVGEG